MHGRPLVLERQRYHSPPVLAGRCRRLDRGPRGLDGILRRDGRYALHSETCPPPRQDDGFALTGRAGEVTDPAVQRLVRARVLTERGGNVWPGFDEEVIFELGIEGVLLTLTQAGGPFPAGLTIWRAGNKREAEAAAPSGIVT